VPVVADESVSECGKEDFKRIDTLSFRLHEVWITIRKYI
jgi:hypothetical protein